MNATAIISFLGKASVMFGNTLISISIIGIAVIFRAVIKAYFPREDKT